MIYAKFRDVLTEISFPARTLQVADCDLFGVENFPDELSSIRLGFQILLSGYSLTMPLSESEAGRFWKILF
ncbi:MAG TPA: hypothetical protein DCY03_12255 [Planctomycetaceae bacterium]|nr:hypothetical protein [Planctomycetaceae bacterium]|tara:strand:- start:13186 stop:13398 length:213 start_codon:yes stop_codon:yes gene_type:complete